MRKKNIDYAQEGNPYENFETFGLLGILVRLSDKLARLRRYVENGGKFAVEDEGRVDTVRDAINYLVLFEGMAQREAMRKNPASQSAPDADGQSGLLQYVEKTSHYWNPPAQHSNKPHGSGPSLAPLIWSETFPDSIDTAYLLGREVDETEDHPGQS